MQWILREIPLWKRVVGSVMAGLLLVLGALNLPDEVSSAAKKLGGAVPGIVFLGAAVLLFVLLWGPSWWQSIREPQPEAGTTVAALPNKAQLEAEAERLRQERALEAGVAEQIRVLTNQHEEDVKKLRALEKEKSSLKNKLEYAELRIENIETERIREMWSPDCESACDLATRALQSAITVLSNRKNTMAAVALSAPLNELANERRLFKDALEAGSRVPFSRVKERLEKLLDAYWAACAWHNKSLIELPDLLSDANVATDKDDYARWLTVHKELVAAVSPVLRRTPHIDIVGEIDEKDLREILFVSDRHRRPAPRSDT